MSGPDSADFLHRLTSVDIKNLAVGNGSLGTWLSAQGKARAFFYIWHLNKDRFGFEFDAGADGQWKQALLSAIDHMTFSEQLAVSEVPKNCAWKLGPSFEGGSSTLACAETKDGITCHHGSRDFGQPWSTLWTPASGVPVVDLSNGEAQLTAAHWEALRIAACRPWIEHELFVDKTLPLEVGLDDAVSRNKGCYPGQEVMERMYTYGAPSRRLCRLKWLEEEGKTASLLDPSTGQGVAEITTPSNALSHTSFLALVKKLSAKVGTRFNTSDGASAEIEYVTPWAP